MKTAGRSDLPSFAIVGAVNHGKSSVVAALAENDDVRISAMPGETVANRRFHLGELLVFYDTPGFQNARKALAALDAQPADEEPLSALARFVDDHRTDPAFEAECRLLQPIIDGAGIVYVVDGSRPLRDINLCEMEILRRTGAPRLAIINRTDATDHVDAWKSRLDQHFNIVRTFDAHRASHADRTDLIEALASIERGWKDRLLEASRLIETERRQRIDETAASIGGFVVEALSYVERVPTGDRRGEPDTAAAATALSARFLAAIAAKEHDAHRRIVATYAHRRVTPEAMPDDLFAHDLFAEETWQLLGLDARQLVAASTLAGGVAGAGIDAITLGHSFGLGAALGAVAGGGGAFLLGKRRPEVAIAWPGDRLRTLFPAALRFGGGAQVVGPLKAENFPWILLDRALALFAAVYTRSHARRDDGALQVEALLPLLAAQKLGVAHWPDAARAAGSSAFRTLRAGKRLSDAQRAALERAVVEALDRIAAAEHAFLQAPREHPAARPVFPSSPHTARDPFRSNP